MSVKIMSAVWELDLPQNLKFVLLAFADHADDDGVCYPSVARIAWKSGYSDRQIKAIGKKLRGLGLIELLKKADPAQGKAAVYRVRPDSGKKLASFRAGEKTSPGEGISPGGNRGQSRGSQAPKAGEVATAPQPSCNNRHKQPSCAESSSALLVSPPAPPAVIELPLNDGSQYPVLADDVTEWKHLYPAVSVEQELRNMRGWLLANREKRKTRGGIKRFINGWLAKRQDKSGTEGVNGSRKGDRRKAGGQYHSGDPSRTYDRAPDFIVS